MTITLWIGVVYAFGSALGQAQAVGLHKSQRIAWIGLKIALDLATLATWKAEQALGSGQLFVLVSACAVLLCGVPLAWYLSRRVDIDARAHAYAAGATLLIALTATSGWIDGFLGHLLDAFWHPFGQLFLRDISFGIALWSTARATPPRGPVRPAA